MLSLFNKMNESKREDRRYQNSPIMKKAKSPLQSILKDQRYPLKKAMTSVSPGLKNPLSVILGGLVISSTVSSIYFSGIDESLEDSEQHGRKRSRRCESKIPLIPQRVYDICTGMPFYNIVKEFIDDHDKKEAMMNVFKKVTLDHFKKGKIIFKENDMMCDHAYVVLKGRVGVIRKDSNKLEPKIDLGLDSPLIERHPKSPDSKSASRMIGSRLMSFNNSSKKSMFVERSPRLMSPMRVSHFSNMKPVEIRQEVSGESEFMLMEEIYEDVDYEIANSILDYGKLIVKLGYGEIFGQNALQRNEPRNASIIALEDVYLMVIHKKEFDLIKNYYSSEFNSRKQFITSVIPQIDSIKDLRTLTKLLQYFEMVTFSRVRSNELLGYSFGQRESDWE